MPHAVEHVTIGMSVLALSFIIESYSLRVAYQEIRAEARRQNSTVMDYIMSGSDPMNVAVLFEDSAAVLGVGVASSGLVLSYVTGIAQFDAIGSIVNGCLMGAIAIFLIQKNRHMLVGQAVPAPRLLRVVRILEVTLNLGPYRIFEVTLNLEPFTLRRTLSSAASTLHPEPQTLILKLSGGRCRQQRSRRQGDHALKP
jgi:divalent metal cation (Fe/Co/Zn/Cd) transporter